MISWLTELQTTRPVEHGILVLCTVATLGISLGAIKVRGFSLGVAGVLFSGVLAGHFGLSLHPAVRSFVQDFGLILFVVALGLQVGPGFTASLRAQGLRLNALATGIVLLGVACAWAASRLLGISTAVSAGLLAGATTNTPSLGAVQEALRSQSAAGLVELPALGYAAAYPGGIIGIIAAMVLLKALFRVDIATEIAALEAAARARRVDLARMVLRVTNANLAGRTIGDIPGMDSLHVNVSRHRAAGAKEVQMATRSTRLALDDELLAVGRPADLDQFQVIVGERHDADLMRAPGPVIFKRAILTRSELVGQTLRELDFEHIHDVAVTRVARAEIEMPAAPDLALQYGDVLQVVGREEDVASAAEALGNSLKDLNHARVTPLFFAIVVGVLIGLIPLAIPGLPSPVRLGLAGGPLVVAILLSRAGRLGPLLFRLPENANILLRTLGMTLFLGCVGIKAGGHFFETIGSAEGFRWVMAGLAITLVPLMAAGVFARVVWKMNFIPLCGLLSGSMTDPPALAFSRQFLNSDAAAESYAAVYPLTMLLRILLAQGFVLLLA